MLKVRLGEHHRHALFLEPGHHFGEALGERGRHAFERLVEQEELGPAQERAGERGKLLLAAGELGPLPRPEFPNLRAIGAPILPTPT